MRNLEAAADYFDQPRRLPNTPAYTGYLKSPRWKSLTLWAMERADGRCEWCGNDEALQVHHRTYKRLGHEWPGDLVVLCNQCHEETHGITSRWRPDPVGVDPPWVIRSGYQPRYWGKGESVVP